MPTESISIDMVGECSGCGIELRDRNLGRSSSKLLGTQVLQGRYVFNVSNLLEMSQNSTESKFRTCVMLVSNRYDQTVHTYNSDMKTI